VLKLSNKQLKMFGTLQLGRSESPPKLDGCPRKWGYNYLDGFPVELGPALIDGIKHHDVCAHLLRDNRMPLARVLQPGVILSSDDVRPEGHFGKMARASLPLLPVKLPGVWEVEPSYTIEWTTRNGTTVKLDIKPDAHTKWGAVGHNSGLYFIDWKSCSGRKWALKSLAEEVQAQLYAFGLCSLLGYERADAVWIYVDKKTYDAWRMPHVIWKDKAEAWLHDNIDQTIDLIVTLREQAPQGCELPRDLSACEGKGKFCDFAGKCFSNKTPPIISLEEIRAFIERKAA
jgi:hypothetical protein